MKKVISYAAVDVDDNSYHLSILNSDTGEIQTFSCRPTPQHLIKKLRKIVKNNNELKICYESTYLGFSLCRSLKKAGIFCEVIASSMIPEFKGKRVKTDRLDSEKLVIFYSQGLLTSVQLPNEEQELIRDLIRTRSYLVSQAKSLKNHILSTCRRTGWDYKQECNLKAPKHWTSTHLQWLRSKVSNCESKYLKFNLSKVVKD